MKEILLSEIFGSACRAEYRKVARKWVEDNCNLRITYGIGTNQMDITDVQIMSGDPIIVVMDSVGILPTHQLSVLLAVCASNGVQVDLDCGDGLVQPIL